VKILDANVLLNAVNTSADHHQDAREWLDEALNSKEAIGLPWLVIIAFIRISTLAHGFPRPLSVPEALSYMRGWLAVPTVVVINASSTDDHLDSLEALLTAANHGGNLVNDAHIAAIAEAVDAEVVTFDRDFDRFAGVRRVVPQHS